MLTSRKECLIVLIIHGSQAISDYREKTKIKILFDHCNDFISKDVSNLI